MTTLKGTAIITCSTPSGTVFRIPASYAELTPPKLTLESFLKDVELGRPWPGKSEITLDCTLRPGPGFAWLFCDLRPRKTKIGSRRLRMLRVHIPESSQKQK